MQTYRMPRRTPSMSTLRLRLRLNTCHLQQNRPNSHLHPQQDMWTPRPIPNHLHQHNSSNNLHLQGHTSTVMLIHSIPHNPHPTMHTHHPISQPMGSLAPIPNLLQATSLTRKPMHKHSLHPYNPTLGSLPTLALCTLDSLPTLALRTPDSLPTPALPTLALPTLPTTPNHPTLALQATTNHPTRATPTRASLRSRPTFTAYAPASAPPISAPAWSTSSHPPPRPRPARRST